MGCLAKGLVRCFAVDGVDHDLLRIDVGQCLKPRFNVVRSGIVYVLSFQEHCLYDDVAVEQFEPLADRKSVV